MYNVGCSFRFIRPMFYVNIIIVSALYHGW